MISGDEPARARKAALSREMQFDDEGLVLGRGVLLAKMDADGLCIDDDRLMTLLAVARRDDPGQALVAAVQRAATHWRAGDRALAAICLAQTGLRPIGEEDSERLALAAALLDGGMSPATLAQELGLKLELNIQPRARKYDDHQPRVPAGNGRASGQWTSAGSGDSAAGEAPVVEGRSSSISEAMTVVEGGPDLPEDNPVKKEPDLPKDAVVVTRPDGSTIADPDSTTGKMMAPPRADFKEVYAAGKKISQLPRWRQMILARIALHHFGTYDFQRDKATNTHFAQYVHAANYAVGVYMAGAGYRRRTSVEIAQTYGFFFSSTKYDRNAKEWTEKGWDDANRGAWR